MELQIVHAADMKLLASIFKGNAKFSEEETGLLLNHHEEENINQYYDVIIQKALNERNITLNRYLLTAALLDVMADVSKNLVMDNHQDEIMAKASFLYKVLMLSNLDKIQATL